MKHKTMTLSDGQIIHYKDFHPQEPKALVVIFHGLNEHKERYHKLQTLLMEKGYASICPDRRGHGQSLSQSYPLGHMGDLPLLLQDQVEQMEAFKQAYPNMKLFVFAHSFGSILARLSLKTQDRDFSGVVLTGTPGYRKAAALAFSLASLVCIKGPASSQSPLLNRMGYGTNSQNLSWLSTDIKNIQEYRSDPLCQFYYSRQSYKTIYEASLSLKKRHRANNPDLAIASLVGAKDPITGGPKGHKKSMTLLKKSGYRNTRTFVYENLGHEILNENCPKVYEDIFRFLEDNI